jgi:hypothetical protein
MKASGSPSGVKIDEKNKTSSNYHEWIKQIRLKQ